MKQLNNLLLTVSLLFSLQASAQTIYVKQNASGANDGTSWANAYTKLDVALTAATAGSQVWVAAGTYRPDTSTISNNQFNLLAGVALYGGFAGTETSVNQRNIAANVTTLSGDNKGDDNPLDQTVNRSDNSFHVLWVQNGDTTQRSIVDGFTIRNGNTKTGAADPDYAKRGGGILATAKLTVRNCNFIENAASSGGAIAALDGIGSGLIVYNCNFTNNYSAAQAAGIYIRFATSGSITKCTFKNNLTTRGTLYPQNCTGFVIDSCLFESNRAISGQTAAGMFTWQSTFLMKNTVFRKNSAAAAAAMYNDGRDGTNSCLIEHCLFEGNTCSGYGGGIYNWQVNATIKNCAFRNDTATNAAGIYNDGRNNISVFLVDSCQFENNATTNYGGSGIWNNQGKGTVKNCAFTGNYAPNSASAIYNGNGDFTVIGCRFENGQSSYGGALANYGGKALLQDCLFKNNNASNSGAAMANGFKVVTTIQGCNFETNSAKFGGAIWNQNDSTFLIVENSTFNTNSAITSGGALANGFKSNVTLRGSTFQGNTAKYGGGVFVQNDSTNLTIEATTFDGNNADNNGGALNLGAGIITNVSKTVFKNNSAAFGAAIDVSEDSLHLAILNVSRSQFNENLALTQAAGINVADVRVNLVNCLFNANQNLGANPGGAISNNGFGGKTSEVKATNCTFTGNSDAAGGGAGISQFESDSGKAVLTLQNCIFANDGDNYLIEMGTPTVISNGGNISSDLTMTTYLNGPSDVNNTDPALIDPANYNFYPQAGSPCINTGIASGAPTVDITGNTRIGVPDKGAFEFGTVATQDLSNPVALSLTPNPATDLVRASISNGWNGKVMVQVRDASGKLIHFLTDEKSGADWMLKLDVSRLPAGVYMVRVQMGGSVYGGKIVKA